MIRFPEIIIFLPIGITAYFTVTYICNYFDLRRNGEIIKATIVHYTPVRVGSGIPVSKVMYEILDAKYETFVHYTMLSFFLPKRIGSEHYVFVSKDNPERCIFAVFWPIIIELCLLILMVYGGVYVMNH